MARTTHTTATERENVRSMITMAGGTAEQADALSAAVEALAGLDLELAELKGAVHNTLVVANRNPEVKQAQEARGLEVARNALKNDLNVQISGRVSPKRYAYMIGKVTAITPAGKVTVVGWDGRPTDFGASLITRHVEA